eukprot:TCONS_00063185-protein
MPEEQDFTQVSSYTNWMKKMSDKIKKHNELKNTQMTATINNDIKKNENSSKMNNENRSRSEKKGKEEIYEKSWAVCQCHIEGEEDFADEKRRNITSSLQEDRQKRIRRHINSTTSVEETESIADDFSSSPSTSLCCNICLNSSSNLTTKTTSTSTSSSKKHRKRKGRNAHRVLLNNHPSQKQVYSSYSTGQQKINKRSSAPGDTRFNGGSRTHERIIENSFDNDVFEDCFVENKFAVKKSFSYDNAILKNSFAREKENLRKTLSGEKPIRDGDGPFVIDNFTSLNHLQKQQEKRDFIVYKNGAQNDNRNSSVPIDRRPQSEYGRRKHVTYDVKTLYRVNSDAPPRSWTLDISRSSDSDDNMLFPKLRKNFKFGTKPNGRAASDGCTTQGSRKGSQRRTTSAEFIQEFLGPADTPVNARLFGGKKGVQYEIERAKSYGYVIHPCSKLRQYWDLLIMTMLVLNMMVLPLDIAFFDDNSLISFHVISDTLCMVDIILNFRTGYHLRKEKHEFELGHKKIAIHYLKTWFTLDLISSLPLHYILLAVSGQNVTLGLKGASRALKFLKVAKLLNLLKLLRLSRIIRGIAQYEEVYCVTTGFIRYIKLVCMMLMVAHWNGCLHFLVPMLQDFPEKCWVQECKIVNEPWYVQYGWALFKTLSHMLCIGYGRYIPALLDEALITIFSMVTGATFYALFIAHSMAFIIQRDSSKSTYQEKIKQIEEYMHHRNVPPEIKKRISNYFEHKYHQGRFFDEQAIMSVIGKPLREEIVHHTCKDLVESVPFLKAASPHFVTAVLDRLTFDVYLSGDAVIKEGTTGDEMFFVRKGCLDVSVKGRLIYQLKGGEYFGDICMLTDDTKHIITVEARTTCDLFSLSYKTLATLLIQYPEVRPILEQAALNQLMNITQTIELLNAAREKQKEKNGSNGPYGSNNNSPVVKKRSTLSRQSSLNQLKELINGTVETLAAKIKTFKEENDVIAERFEDSMTSQEMMPSQDNTPCKQKKDESAIIVENELEEGTHKNKDSDPTTGSDHGLDDPTKDDFHVSTSF